MPTPVPTAAWCLLQCALVIGMTLVMGSTHLSSTQVKLMQCSCMLCSTHTGLKWCSCSAHESLSSETDLDGTMALLNKECNGSQCSIFPHSNYCCCTADFQVQPSCFTCQMHGMGVFGMFMTTSSAQKNACGVPQGGHFVT